MKKSDIDYIHNCMGIIDNQNTKDSDNYEKIIIDLTKIRSRIHPQLLDEVMAIVEKNGYHFFYNKDEKKLHGFKFI
ncbi:hypothetical protein HGP28_02010 [Vibrio sp. SM6]|uniref:Uncharacterized protein n=1 Tax=Vibrio agarilyticus TaxID=2726741 RepID=A0A7X8YFA2_9VIBR|nr:hypothetical protein [Vibrio agarilyticus]NLS11663.1 hypothetical protein [Vibrio agarilyticus]